MPGPDESIANLADSSAIADTDLVAMVKDMGTTPATKGRAWSLLKSTLKTYFDTLYLALVAPGTTGNVLTSNGSAWTSAAPTGGGGGQTYNAPCRLTLSSTNLLLSPYNGNQIMINSVLKTIPDAGVTLAPPAVASTTYYIYVYMNGSTMTLEYSATAYAVQAGTGVTIKSGDATRTLVGMARTTAGNAWADSTSQRFVRSYFNRRSIGAEGHFTTNRTVTSATFVEINSEVEVFILIWADETVLAAGCISAYQNIAANGYLAIAFDSTSSPATLGAYVSGTQPSGFSVAAFQSGLSEGYHYVTLIAKESANNLVILGGTAGAASGLEVSVR